MIISPTMRLAYNEKFGSGHTLPQGMFATGLFDCCQPGCGTCCWAMCCTPCAFGDLNALWLPGDEPCCAGSCGGGCFLHFMLGGFMSIPVAQMAITVNSNVQQAMPVQAATPYNPQGQHQNHPPQTGYPQQQQPVAYAGQQQQQPVYSQQQQQPVYSQQQQQQSVPVKQEQGQA